MADILRLSPRQRKLVNGLLAGKSTEAAMIEAGYSRTSARHHGPRTVATGGVSCALAEARARAASAAELTAEIIIERLEEARQVALAADPPQAHAAVAAAMGQARIAGLVIDRSVSEVLHKPAPLPGAQLELTPDQWREQFLPK